MAASRRSTRRRSAKRPPQQGTHWALYLGVAVLALGSMSVAVAAMILR